MKRQVKNVDYAFFVRLASAIFAAIVACMLVPFLLRSRLFQDRKAWALVEVATVIAFLLQRAGIQDNAAAGAISWANLFVVAVGVITGVCGLAVVRLVFASSSLQSGQPKQ